MNLLIENLQQALLKNYEVERVKLISPILGGLQHRHFFVATDRGDWRLRLYSENKSDWLDVVNEYKVLEVLIAAGLPVYQPVINRQGEFLTHFTTNGARHTFSMVTFLPGEPLIPERVEKEHLRVVGEVLAKIHKALEKLPFDSSLPRLDVYQKFSSAQEGFDTLIEQNYLAVDWTMLARSKKLVGKVRRLVKDSHQGLLARSAFGAEQWLHGDYAQSNLLFKDGNLSGILDFTSLMWGLPIDDLAEGIVGFYWVIDSFTAEEFIENFVTGYKLPVTRLIRLLVIMGLARRFMEAFKKPPTIESRELQQRWIEKFSNKLETIL